MMNAPHGVYPLFTRATLVHPRTWRKRGPTPIIFVYRRRATDEWLLEMIGDFDVRIFVTGWTALQEKVQELAAGRIGPRAVKDGLERLRKYQ